jgi:hypothetical protein
VFRDYPHEAYHPLSWKVTIKGSRKIFMLLESLLISSMNSQVSPMARMEEWAAFFSGNYQGRIRPPGGEWEDLIGSVKLECTASKEGCLNVMVMSLEFDTWVGCLRLEDRVLEGSTGQGDTYFKCAFLEREEAEGIQGVFYGDIYKSATEPLYELNLASEWRKPRPEQR